MARWGRKPGQPQDRRPQGRHTEPHLRLSAAADAGLCLDHQTGASKDAGIHFSLACATRSSFRRSRSGNFRLVGAPAVKRETEEDWGEKRWGYGSRSGDRGA
jgi:hypothetical protein